MLGFCTNCCPHFARSLISSIITPSLEVLYNVKFRKTLRLQLQLELYSSLQIDNSRTGIYWWRVGHALLIETALNALHRTCSINKMPETKQKHLNIPFLSLNMRCSETQDSQELSPPCHSQHLSQKHSRIEIEDLRSFIANGANAMD